MGLFCDSLINRHLTIEQTCQPILTTQFPITTNPMRFFGTEQECRRLPSEKRDRFISDRSRFHTLKEACGIERLAPERRGLSRAWARPTRGFRPFLLVLRGSGQAALYCAHRTSTFLSCAFCEQEGHLATPSHPSASERRGRGAAGGAGAKGRTLPFS